MSDREGYLQRRDQLLMQDEEIAELKAELAALREAAQAAVDSAGNWIHEAQHSDDLVKLAALLQEKGE